METLRRVLFSVLLASAIAQIARGDSPKITAVLTSSEVVVGETVQLQIQIDNAGTSVKPPSEIDVPGLQIHFTGKSTEMRWKNFTASSSITYAIGAHSAPNRHCIFLSGGGDGSVLMVFFLRRKR